MTADKSRHCPSWDDYYTILQLGPHKKENFDKLKIFLFPEKKKNFEFVLSLPFKRSNIKDIDHKKELLWLVLLYFLLTFAMMILYVKTISGVSLKIELQPGSSVLDLKKKVQFASAEKYRLDAIGLVFGTQSLEDNSMIADYNLQDESTLTLVSILLKLFFRLVWLFCSYCLQRVTKRGNFDQKMVKKIYHIL